MKILIDLSTANKFSYDNSSYDKNIILSNDINGNYRLSFVTRYVGFEMFPYVRTEMLKLLLTIVR